MGDFVVTSPPRHRCFCCGTCCQGVFVEVDGEEAERATRLGAELGIEEAVTDGGLRFENGACVFLGESMQCRLHATYGAEAKPLRCQQYPFVAIRTETGELRAGIDPSCENSWRSWRDAPVVQPGEAVVRHRPIRQEQAPLEGQLLKLSGHPGLTLTTWLRVLAAAGPGDGPPVGFAGRLIAQAQVMHLTDYLERSDTGAAIARALHHLPDHIAGWDMDTPPPWPELAPELDAFVVEATRRMIFLRLAGTHPSVLATALLTLSGAVICAWASPEPTRFGPAFSAWTRAIRVRRFWQPLAPDPMTLRWLATGQASEA